MSDERGSCDCADKSHSVSSYTADIVETEMSDVSALVTEVPAAEDDGNCKCGSSCACVNCTCGSQ